MKIYKVEADPTISQIIQRDDCYELFNFDCTSKKNVWKKDGWYIYNPVDPKSNFYSTGGTSSLVFDQKVYNSDLLTLFEISGEVLPIEIGNKHYYFINVKGCINALDLGKTTHYIYPDGTKGRIKDFIFHPQRIGGNPLFKVPETRKNDVLCFEGICDPWDEFKGRYEELGFTGLNFIELYNSALHV